MNYCRYVEISRHVLKNDMEIGSELERDENKKARQIMKKMRTSRLEKAQIMTSD